MDNYEAVDTVVEQESVQADAAQAPTQEESGVMAISALLQDEAEAPSDSAVEEAQDAEPQQQEEQKEEKVNGGIKGRLLAEFNKGRNAGISDARKEWEAKEAEYKAVIERLQGYELKEKAAKIAKENNVSDAIAMFLAKNGFVTDGETEETVQPKTPARDAATGRFVKKEAEEPVEQQSSMATMLYEQAQNIKRMNGIDVVDMFSKADAETRSRIANGEMDFYDFVREASAATDKEQPAKRTPPNIKSNSAGSVVNAKNMSDDDIDRMNAFMMQGGVIDTRK